MKLHKRGFTLIELLVVVLIIGILAAVAVPQYQKAVVKSRLATLKNLTKSIANAQEIYYLANNHYASKFEDLDIDMPGGKNETNSTTNNYVYDWGYCKVYYAEGVDAFTKCTNTLSGISYQIYAVHSNNTPNRITCVADGNISSLPNQVCKAETNDPNPYAGDGGTWYAWDYQ